MIKDNPPHHHELIARMAKQLLTHEGEIVVNLTAKRIYSLNSNSQYQLATANNQK